MAALALRQGARLQLLTSACRAAELAGGEALLAQPGCFLFFPHPALRKSVRKRARRCPNFDKILQLRSRRARGTSRWRAAGPAAGEESGRGPMLVLAFFF